MNKGEKKRKVRFGGSKSHGTVPAFLLKTYEILENPAYNDIISWNKEGNAFIVKRINEFSEKVLPRYFKHNNFASFVRQLNMYDFHKSRHENNENEFRHKMFKRGQKQLLTEIKRKVSDHTSAGNQLVPASKDMDIDKIKKEATHFNSEIGTIKRHQSDLEKVTKMIYNQNTQLIKENKLLWNELIKNREKYEKKMEKLIYFIFSVVNPGNQLGPSTERKALTNAELSETLNDLTGDPEQTKKLLGEGENGLGLTGDKKDNDKLIQRISSFLQSKGSDTNLDTLLEQLQSGGNIDDIFKNQPEGAEHIPNMGDQQNLDPNLNLSKSPSQTAKARGKAKGRQRRGGPAPMPNEGPEDEEFKEGPTKHIKTETEPTFNLRQNIMRAPEPLNILNNDMIPERGLSNFNIGLSRDPSYIDSNGMINGGQFQSPTLMPTRSNQFTFANAGPFMNPMKEEGMNELYNMSNFGRSEDKNNDTQSQQQKNESQIEEGGIPMSSPVTFIHNNGHNAYNFGQPFDDSLYNSRNLCERVRKRN